MTIRLQIYATTDEVAADVQRRAVNEWIRTSGIFDGVIDFEAAVPPVTPLAIAGRFVACINAHDDRSDG